MSHDPFHACRRGSRDPHDRRGVYRALRLASAALDALVWIDIQSLRSSSSVSKLTPVLGYTVIVDNMDEPTIPIACTLSPNQTGHRLEEFEKLFANHLRELTRPAPRQARFVFQPADEVEAAARDLFAREQECCAFFDFVVERQGAELIVQAEVPAGAEASLDGLATLARHAAPAAAAD